MKKILAILVAMMVIMGFAACSAEFVDPIAKSAEEYAKIDQAKNIHQTVEVMDGKLAMFVHETNYALEGGNYTVTDTRKTLNAAGSEEAYTVVENEPSTAEKAAIFASKLKFENKFFKPGYYTSGNSFRGGVKDDFIDEMFGLNPGHATMTNVVLEMTSANAMTTQMVITYASDNETNVKITISFEY